MPHKKYSDLLGLKIHEYQYDVQDIEQFNFNFRKTAVHHFS